MHSAAQPSKQQLSAWPKCQQLRGQQAAHAGTQKSSAVPPAWYSGHTLVWYAAQHRAHPRDPAAGGEGGAAALRSSTGDDMVDVND